MKTIQKCQKEREKVNDRKQENKMMRKNSDKNVSDIEVKKENKEKDVK